MTEISMVDCLGKEINIGDIVLYFNHTVQGLGFGVVKQKKTRTRHCAFEKVVVVEHIPRNNDSNGNFNVKNPHRNVFILDETLDLNNEAFIAMLKM